MEEGRETGRQGERGREEEREGTGRKRWYDERAMSYEARCQGIIEVVLTSRRGNELVLIRNTNNSRDRYTCRPRSS